VGWGGDGEEEFSTLNTQIIHRKEFDDGGGGYILQQKIIN
jgi:hypothetical protein